MAYTSPSDIREVMRKLPTSITDQDIQFHIDKAEAFVNGLFGEVFTVPFNPIPTMVKHITIDFAVFFMAEDLYSSNMPNMDAYQEKRYNRAMDLVTKILDGDLKLTLPDGSIVRPKTIESGFATTNDEQIFSYDEPEW